MDGLVLSWMTMRSDVNRKDRKLGSASLNFLSCKEGCTLRTKSFQHLVLLCESSYVG